MHSNTGNPRGSDFLSDLKEWWTTCPLFTRFIIFTCFSIMIFCTISHTALLLVNIPAETFGNLELTRLLFCPFTFYKISELIIAFIAYLPFCADQEKRWGTLKTLIDFFIKNLEINLLFLFVCSILGLIYEPFNSLESYGLWGIFFVHIAETYLENPEGVTPLLYSPLQIKMRYYPIVLMALFSIISHGARFDILIATFVGIIHHKFLNPIYFGFFNDRKMAAWETSDFVAWLRTVPHYVSVGTPAVHGTTTVNNYDNSMVRKAGNEEDFEGTGHDMGGYGGEKSYAQVQVKDMEDLADDIEKQ